MSVKPARKHHTVPNFYLRRFAKNDTIYTMNFNLKRGYAQNIIKASVVTDFYNVEIPLAHDPWGLFEDISVIDFYEKLLGKNESNAGVVFSKILDKDIWPLSSEDREILALFIALQSVRTIINKEEMHKFYLNVLKLTKNLNGDIAFLRELSRLTKKEYSASERKEIIENFGSDFSFKFNSIFYMHQMITDAESIAKRYVGLPWALVNFSPEVPLFTSIAPVSYLSHSELPYILHAKNFNDNFFSNKIGNSIVFPLSREMGLIMLDHTNKSKKKNFSGLVKNGAFDKAIDADEDIDDSFLHALDHPSKRIFFCNPDDINVLPLMSGQERVYWDSVLQEQSDLAIVPKLTSALLEYEKSFRRAGNLF